jgi:nitrite reductase (NADH) small subunit
MSGQGEFHRAGSLAQLETSDRLSATIGGKSVVVFKTKGALIATQGKCPHAGGPICDAALGAGKITCAWHGYEFNLTTGACDEDPSLTLARYEVRVTGDDVLVKL